MENPIKTATNVSALVRWFIIGVAVLAILDVTNMTDWLLYPVSTAREKFNI